MQQLLDFCFEAEGFFAGCGHLFLLLCMSQG
jgi:hypothetical protein